MLSRHVVRVLIVPALALAPACADSCCTPPPCEETEEGCPENAELRFDTRIGLDVTDADDADGDLTNGVQLDVTLLMLNDEAGEYDEVTVTNNGGVEVTGGFDENNPRQATVRINLECDADGADNVLTATSGDLSASNEPFTLTCTLDNEPPLPPVCVITDPTDDPHTYTTADGDVSVHCEGGEGAVADAMQTGTVTCTAVDDAGLVPDETALIQLSGGDGTGTINFAANGDYTVTCENAGATPPVSDSFHAVVDVAGVTEECIITSPTANQILTDADDGDGNPLNGFTIDIEGTCTSAGNVTVDVSCTDGTSTINRSGVVAQTGAASPFSFTFTADDLAFPTCTATATLGILTDSVDFTLDLPASVPVIDVATTADAGADGFFVAADDTDTADGEADVDLPVSATATGLPAGSWTASAVITRESDGSTVSTTDLGAITNGAAINFVAELPNANGETYVVTVTATDGTNSTAGFTLLLAVDTAAPNIDFFLPTAGQTIADSSVNMQVQSNNTPNGTQGSITVDGTTQTCTFNAGFCASVFTIADGAHSASATVTDAAGNVSNTATVNFSSDSTALQVASFVVVKAAINAPADVLNVADNGNTETSGNVTSNVNVTFDSTDINFNSITLVTPAGTFTPNGQLPPSGVSFTNLAFGQGVSTLTLGAADTAGNPVVFTFTLTVDTVRPTVAVQVPANTEVLNAADDTAGGTAGLQFNVLVGSDEEGATVTVRNGATDLGTGTIAGGSASIGATLPEGAVSLTALVADAAGNSQTSTAVTATVDSVPPTLTIVDPGAINIASDVDGTLVGVQRDIVVNTTGLEAGRIIVITSALGSPQCEAPATGNSTTIRCTYTAEGSDTLTASATDAAGNPGSDTQTATVVTGVYFVTITAPPTRAGHLSIGAAEDTNAGTAGAQVAIVADTDAPQGTPTALLVNGTQQATGTVGAGGAITFNVTLADNTSGTIEITVDDGSKDGTSSALPFSVDLGLPTTTITNPAGATVSFGKAQDEVAGVAGLQVTMTVDVTECENGVLRIVHNAEVLGSINVNASGTQTLSLQISDPTDGDAELWQAVCTDAEGNTPTTPDSVTATVDTNAPTCGTITNVVGNVRTGAITSSFTQPGDNGTSGTATSVQIAYSKDVVINDTNFGGVGQIVDTIAGAGGGAINHAPSSALDYDHTWSIAVRATDDVGNRCTLSVSSLATLVTTQLVIAPPAGNPAGWGQSISGQRGDINGDGFDDFVIGAPGEFTGGAGGFEVILGDQNAASINRQFVTPPAALVPCGVTDAPPCTPLEIGWSVSILPDLDGDNFREVLAVGYDDRFNNEYLLIYKGNAFGVNALPTGMLQEEAGFAFTGFGAGSVGDVDGDGDEDWAVPSPGAGFSTPSVYLFLNNGTIPGAPSGATVEAAASTTITHATIPISNAVIGIGDGTGDNRDEMVIVSSPAAGQARVFVVPGRASWPLTFDLATLTPVLLSGAGDFSGIDARAGDFNDDGQLDVAIASQSDVTLLTANAGALTQQVHVPFTMAFNPAGFAVGDFNGAGSDDLVGGGLAAGSSIELRVTNAGFTLNATANASYAIAADSANARFHQLAVGNFVGDAASGDDWVVADDNGTVILRF